MRQDLIHVFVTLALAWCCAEGLSGFVHRLFGDLALSRTSFQMASFAGLLSIAIVLLDGVVR